MIEPKTILYHNLYNKSIQLGLMDAVHVFTNNVFCYSAILTYMEEGYYLNFVSYF